MTIARGARAPHSLPALLLGLCLLLLLAACGGAQAPGGPTYPPLSGRVVDNADMLSPADEAALTQRLEALQRATSRQLVVATVPEMGGYQIEEYANGLFRHWQLGQRTANNGVLLLVARTEKRIRIETGYNMEAIVTDAFSGRVIREQMQPRFRENDYAGGIRAGTDALLAQLQAPPEAAEQAAVQAQQAQNSQRDERRESGSGGSPFALIFWIGVSLFIVVGLVGSGLSGRRYRRKGGWNDVVIWGPGSGYRSKRRRGGWDDWGGGGWGGGSWGGGGGGGSSWGGGGSSWGGGGGGFSGGGGSSGGGGASGGW